MHFDYEKMYKDIPIERQNAITKQELCKIWNIKNERTARLVVSELRKIDNGDNYIIVSSSTNGTKGYYKTDNVEEIIAYKKETIKRAVHTMQVLKKINRVLSNKNQLNFFN